MFMKIIKISERNHSAIVKQAVAVLKRGGVIVYPTETAYGLGADFFNPGAVKKVYQIKSRQYQKPLSAIVSDFKMARQLVKFDELSLRLAKKYWPGALTLVLKETINKLQVTKNFQFPISNFQTLGLRISSNKLAVSIVKKLGRPITATSANVSGKKELYDAKAVSQQFRNRKYQPDLIIDVGKLPKRQPSTVLQIINGKIKVLRKGEIALSF